MVGDWPSTGARLRGGSPRPRRRPRAAGPVGIFGVSVTVGCGRVSLERAGGKGVSREGTRGSGDLGEDGGLLRRETLRGWGQVAGGHASSWGARSAVLEGQGLLQARGK